MARSPALLALLIGCGMTMKRIAGHAEHARHQLGGGDEPLGHDAGGG
jgi:hypothetical protein